MDRVLFAAKPSTRTLLIANERAKLTAGYVNAVAGSVFTVGGLAPTFAVLYTNTTPVIPLWAIVGISVVCWIASGALHVSARRYLGELM
ncbi:hypothetical protein ASF22_17515 [Methylobacterium sp. Leaf87]|uniref:hypothetical protein n=1 Tax=Methylobacterium sp. Leaf87 TaxID=1736243 RepID=UPI0006F3BF8C|nr:hypothetical protein [Methylobacterium sp. Leaf87]KQO69902.1 hypothetical protein ASF22_17515 [Methylobacterium sp. Leaf87]